jgi:hypothetical protein
MRIATGDEPEDYGPTPADQGKNAAAVELGRKGGKARADAISARLATTSARKELMPVTLPPGRARLVTRPNFTGILHLSRLLTGLPLLIPTDRAAPSYQLLVLSLASLPLVLFVAITDVLSFGARTAVRSFLDIIFDLRLGKRTPAFFAMAKATRKVPVAVNSRVKGLPRIGFLARDSRGGVR